MLHFVLVIVYSVITTLIVLGFKIHKDKRIHELEKEIQQRILEAVHSDPEPEPAVGEYKHEEPKPKTEPVEIMQLLLPGVLYCHIRVPTDKMIMMSEIHTIAGFRALKFYDETGEELDSFLELTYIPETRWMELCEYIMTRIEEHNSDLKKDMTK